MKKRGALKKFLSLALSSAMIISMLSAVSVSAEESEEDNGPELYLISETETVLEDGTIVTDRYYSDSPKSDAAVCSTAATTSGTETAKHEKKFSEKQNDGTIADIVTIWVQAKFSWNSTNKTATVDTSTIKTGCTVHASGSTKKDEKIEYGSNQGSEDIFGLGHIYAYVRYRVQLTSKFSYSKVYEVYIDRNRLGEEKKDDGSSKGTLSFNQTV